nr:ferritin, mitochondrial-like [Loxodonta africana]
MIKGLFEARRPSQSHQGQLLQQCLKGTQCLPTSPQPAAPTSLQLPPRNSALGCPKAPTAPALCSRLSSATTMTTASPLQEHQNYNQDSKAGVEHPVNMELYASCVYLSMSYYFDSNNVALKNYAKYFRHQSHEERPTCLETEEDAEPTR